MRITICRTALFAALSLLPAAPAAAHHVMDGKLPQTFIQGLLSGLAHPIIGLDHFAVLVAAGCIASLSARGALLAATFVLVMMGGVGVHLVGATLPAAESLVALTAVLFGAILLLMRMLSVGTLAAFFAAAGLIHGYALGESIVGAEPAPLYAYLAGLAIIQSAIAVGAMLLARRVASLPWQPLRIAGGMIAAFGLMVLLQQFVSA